MRINSASQTSNSIVCKFDQVPPPDEIDFSKEIVVVSAMRLKTSVGPSSFIDGACEVEGLSVMPMDMWPGTRGSVRLPLMRFEYKLTPATYFVG